MTTPRAEDVKTFTPREHYAGPCIAAVSNLFHLDGIIEGGSHSCVRCKKYIHAICGSATTVEGERTCPLCTAAPPTQSMMSTPRRNLSQDLDDADPGDDVSEPNPWISSYKPEYFAELLGPVPPRDMAYTFLRKSTVRDLRPVMKSMKSVQTQTVKNGMLWHLMLRAHEIITSCTDGTSSWQNAFGAGHVRFVTDPAHQNYAWFKAPTLTSISSWNPVIPKATQSPKAPPFSLNEWASLVSLLVKDSSIREKLIQSGLDLSRDEQQRSEWRDLFWDADVCPQFNDQSVVPVRDLRGVVDSERVLGSIDPNADDIRPRSSAALKKRFTTIKALFTKAYCIWSKSGENDSEDTRAFHTCTP